MISDTVDTIFRGIDLSDDEKKLILERLAYILFTNQLKGAGYQW